MMKAITILGAVAALTVGVAAQASAQAAGARAKSYLCYPAGRGCPDFERMDQHRGEAEEYCRRNCEGGLMGRRGCTQTPQEQQACELSCRMRLQGLDWPF